MAANYGPGLQAVAEGCQWDWRAPNIFMLLISTTIWSGRCCSVKCYKEPQRSLEGFFACFRDFNKDMCIYLFFSPLSLAHHEHIFSSEVLGKIYILAMKLLLTMHVFP